MIDISPLSRKHARVLILGSMGMLGSAVCRLLKKIDAHLETDGWGVPLALRYPCGNLCDVDVAVDLIRSCGPSHIISAVGFNGGIGFKKSFDIFRTNTVVPLNILEAVRICGSEAKVLFPVASCGYDEPFMFNSDDCGHLKEEYYLHGEPNPSVQPHGYAKRATVLACRYAREQYGIKAVTVCPPTLFGPGDRYEKNRSKVVAGMVRRFVDAVDDGLREVVCWGTGKPVRDLMYVDDAANLILQSLLAYDDSNFPMNLRFDDWDITIEELAQVVAYRAGFNGLIAAGFNGLITFDDSKPDGQMVKVCSNKKMLKVLGEQTPSHFQDCLKATVEDYRERKKKGEFND